MVPVPAGNLIHMWYLHMPICSLHRKHSSLSGRFGHYALIFNVFIGDCRRVKGKQLLKELIFRKCIKIQTKLEFLGCVRRKENRSSEILKWRSTCIQEDNAGLLWKTHVASWRMKLYQQCEDRGQTSASRAVLFQHVQCVCTSSSNTALAFASSFSVCTIPSRPVPDRHTARLNRTFSCRKGQWEGSDPAQQKKQLLFCRRWPKPVSWLLCSWDLSALVIKSQKGGWQKSDN